MFHQDKAYKSQIYRNNTKLVYHKNLIYCNSRIFRIIYNILMILGSFVMWPVVN